MAALVYGDDAERVFCWGQNGRYATLGIEVPSLIVRLSPDHPFVPIEGFGEFWRFTLGWHHVCFQSQARTMHCWGWNESGQHGRGTQLTVGRSPERWSRRRHLPFWARVRSLHRRSILSLE